MIDLSKMKLVGLTSDGIKVFAKNLTSEYKSIAFVNVDQVYWTITISKSDAELILSAFNDETE